MKIYYDGKTYRTERDGLVIAADQESLGWAMAVVCLTGFSNYDRIRNSHEQSPLEGGMAGREDWWNIEVCREPL